MSGQRQDYRIVQTTQLVRLDDEVEVRDGQVQLIENDASLGGYVQVRELTDTDLREFGEIIGDDQ